MTLTHYRKPYWERTGADDEYYTEAEWSVITDRVERLYPAVERRVMAEAPPVPAAPQSSGMRAVKRPGSKPCKICGGTIPFGFTSYCTYACAKQALEDLTRRIEPGPEGTCPMCGVPVGKTRHLYCSYRCQVMRNNVARSQRHALSECERWLDIALETRSKIGAIRG